MNFEWTEEHGSFRKHVRDFINANLPADWGEKSLNFDTGSEYVTAFARDFCPALAAEGLLVPHWPKEYGGQDCDTWHHWILNEEMFAAGEPRGYQYMSVNWAGPAFIKFGTPAQQKAHLARIAGGELFYCQGFSEPDAGSDLPALKTRAERYNDGYRINGQKIWTSAASFADYCILLARTSGERRRGITVFIVPMDTPGITVRVIPGLQGGRALHEVFFDDVDLPESAILGEVDRGWDVVGAILHNERIGAPRYTLTIRGLNHAMDILKAEGRLGSPEIRRDAVIARAACEAASLHCYGVIDDREKDRPPSAITSVARYSIIMADRLVADFIAEYVGDRLVADDDPVLLATYRRAGSSGIAAGAAEIQLNAISGGYLQLPRGA